MNVYANNIANVNTVGYKVLRPSFADCLYTLEHPAPAKAGLVTPAFPNGSPAAEQEQAEGAEGDIAGGGVAGGGEPAAVLSEYTAANWETGHGVYVAKTDFMFTQGGFRNSEQPLDYAIGGEQFFMVQDRNGDTHLTRDGSFTITNITPDAEGRGTWQLVNGMGEFVLDNAGEHITVPFVYEVKLNPDTGEFERVSDEPTDVIDYGELKPMIGLYEVPNVFGLDQAPNNHFEVTPRSGETTAVPDERKVLFENYLENSAVDLATEMVHVIEAQRGYQINSKMITTSDELMRIANALR